MTNIRTLWKTRSASRTAAGSISTFGHYHLPRFLLPEGETDTDAYLTKLCERGFARRYGDRPEVHGRSSMSSI